MKKVLKVLGFILVNTVIGWGAFLLVIYSYLLFKQWYSPYGF